MKFKNKGRISSENVRKEAPRKLNPFELHINRTKHNVLGRKLKSERGLPGVSKNKALMRRKNTLLQEYNARGKNNRFIDHRIGERNKNMTVDDRIMARFAAERMRSFNKKAKFNLSDTEVLTHKGQTLSEIERFEDTRSDDEEDDEGIRTSGTLKGKFVERAHFGGGMLTKSKQDRESLIDELINESKKRKAEIQRTKEDTLEATKQLDEEWKTLGMIVTSTKDTGDLNNQKKDQYDIVMRQLKFEPHGQPSQRLKTDKKIAMQDKEQLEKLEKQRLQQLRDREINKYGSHKSADDLDDGFENIAVDLTESDLTASDSEAETGSEGEDISEGEDDSEAENDSDGIAETESGAKEIDEDEKEEESGEEEENYEPIIKRIKFAKQKEKCEMPNMVSESLGLQEVSAEEESSDEEFDDFMDLMPSVNNESTTFTTHEPITPLSKATVMNEEPDPLEAEPHVELDLPYVLNIPDTYESFQDLLRNRTVKQQNIIFERLVKSNHPSLKAGNKKKMLTLAGHVIKLVSKGDITWESLPVLVSQFNVLKEFNKEETLKMIVESLSTKLQDLVKGAPAVRGVKYLAWYILVFLQPQGLDVLVPVSKPALSLACSLVARSQHGTLALLCCYLLLQDAKRSSLVYPEALSFLHTCIKSTTDPKQKNCEKELKNAKLKVNIRDVIAEVFKLRLDTENNSNEDQKFLYCSVMLLTDFVKVYRKYPESKIMFRQVHQSVSSIKPDVYPPKLRREISELQTLLKVLSSVHLPSLSKSAKKPKALRQYEPSFHTVTVSKYQNGLPAEVQEEQRMLHKYKHEMKGAMRELRRDRVFLANVRLKEKALSDQKRMNKVKEIFGAGAAQQGELRSLKRKE